MLGAHQIVPAALAVLSLLVAGGRVNLVAQEQQTAVTVTGKVVDRSNGEPIQGVTVVVEALDLRLRTDVGGQFVLDGVRPGVYGIELVHRDYDRLGGDLTIDRPGEFALAMSPVTYAEESLVTGIVGVVTDQVSGRPIPEVVVNIPQAGRVARTDGDGFFRLDELLPGRHAVEFTHLGYLPRVDSIRVESQRVTRVRTVLSVEPIALDPLEVTVERRDEVLQGLGFYEREEEGWGHFIDREDLESWASSRLTDAFTRFVGVRLMPDAANPFRRVLVFRRAGEDCIPSVYLDGMLVGTAGGGPLVIDDLVAPQAVAGVELYRGVAGIPPQYWGTGSSCGVVLIWTRRGQRVG